MRSPDFNNRLCDSTGAPMFNNRLCDSAEVTGPGTVA